MANDTALFKDWQYKFAVTGISFLDFDNRIFSSNSAVNPFSSHLVPAAGRSANLALAFIVIRIKLATKIEEN